MEIKSFISAVLLLSFGLCGLALAQTTTVGTWQGNNSWSGNNSFTGKNSFLFINSIPQADQFPGSDMCVKLNAAITYAVAHAIGQVDATRFSGTQDCASNPFSGVPIGGAWTNLTVNFGNVHVRTTEQWVIPGSGIVLRGAGPTNTLIEYTGTGSPIGSILKFATSNPVRDFIQGAQVSGMFFYGDKGNVTDGILALGTHRSLFNNVRVWGVTGCGLHTEFAVTDTYINVRVSNQDAQVLGILNSSHSTPTNGLCFDQLGNGRGIGQPQTTDGTVIDSGAEGVSGAGWDLASATTMTFTSGTAESNAGGIRIASASHGNTFITSDLEENTSYDVQDAGYGNTFVNPLSTKLIHLEGSTKNDKIVNCSCNALTIDSGAIDDYYSGGYGNNSGIITDNGIATNNLLQPSGFGQHPVGKLGSNQNVGFGMKTDPGQSVYGTWSFAPLSTVVFPSIAVTTGQPWKIVIHGVLQNQFDGAGLNETADFLEATSASPTVMVGSLSLAFSVNSKGILQAVNRNGSYAINFSGQIELFPLNGFSSAGSHAISTVGDINTNTGYRENGTAGFSGTKTVGACTLTIAGGIITNVTGC